MALKPPPPLDRYPFFFWVTGFGVFAFGLFVVFRAFFFTGCAFFFVLSSAGTPPPNRCRARIRLFAPRSLRPRTDGFSCLFNFALPTPSSAQSRGASRVHCLRITWYMAFLTFLLSSFRTSRGHRCRPFFPSVLAFNFYLSRIGFSNPTGCRFFIECC